MTALQSVVSRIATETLAKGHISYLNQAVSAWWKLSQTVPDLDALLREVTVKVTKQLPLSSAMEVLNLGLLLEEGLSDEVDQESLSPEMRRFYHMTRFLSAYVRKLDAWTVVASEEVARIEQEVKWLGGTVGRLGHGSGIPGSRAIGLTFSLPPKYFDCTLRRDLHKTAGQYDWTSIEVILYLTPEKERSDEDWLLHYAKGEGKTLSEAIAAAQKILAIKKDRPS